MSSFFRNIITLTVYLNVIFKTEKKERKELEAKDDLVRAKAALSIELLPESDYDREVAQLLRLQAPMSELTS